MWKFGYLLLVVLDKTLVIKKIIKSIQSLALIAECQNCTNSEKYISVTGDNVLKALGPRKRWKV